MTIRVLIADDHPLVRQGLQAALAPMPDVEVVARPPPARPPSARPFCRPDVVVMDLQMPDLNGIDATRQLETLPTAAVLVLTMFDDDDWVFAAMRCRLARGYVLKGAELQIARAITAVAAREAIFDPAVATQVLAYFATPPRTPTKFQAHRPPNVKSWTCWPPAYQPPDRRPARPQRQTVANHISAIFAKLQVADRTRPSCGPTTCGLGHLTNQAARRGGRPHDMLASQRWVQAPLCEW